MTDRLPEEDRADIFPEVLSAVTYKGRLYGMPWLNDWEYLFYNKKMLEEVGASSPAYWPEVIEISKKLKEANIVQYPIIDTWGQAESLVVAWLQYVVGMDGYPFDESGNPVMNQGAPLEALKFMVDNTKEVISILLV